MTNRQHRQNKQLPSIATLPRIQLHRSSVLRNLLHLLLLLQPTTHCTALLHLLRMLSFTAKPHSMLSASVSINSLRHLLAHFNHHLFPSHTRLPRASPPTAHKSVFFKSIFHTKFKGSSLVLHVFSTYFAYSPKKGEVEESSSRARARLSDGSRIGKMAFSYLINLVHGLSQTLHFKRILQFRCTHVEICICQ